MVLFGKPPLESEEDKWRYQLADFVKHHQPELAALSWGLYLQRGESDDVLGIDLQPTPHFIYCPKDAIAELNRKVQDSLRELMGLIDGYQPDKEVLIIGIGNGQVKVINFESNPAPSVCFEQLGLDVDTLLDQLEAGLRTEMGCE